MDGYILAIWVKEKDLWFKKFTMVTDEISPVVFEATEMVEIAVLYNPMHAMIEVERNLITFGDIVRDEVMNEIQFYYRPWSNAATHHISGVGDPDKSILVRMDSSNLESFQTARTWLVES